MKGLEVYVLCLCIFVATAELLGPEGQKKDVKDKVADEEESVEDADTDTTAEQDYVKQLTDAVNKEIVTLHEYAEAIRKSKELPKEDEMNNENQLEQMEFSLKMLKKSLLRHTEEGWLGDVKGGDFSGGELESVDDNPQDILDTLPPLTEEVEPELTPELKEAKEVYEAALAKLQRRSPDLRASVLQVATAADAGYAPAKITLAWSYLFGEGVELDLDKARGIFEELVEQGNADAHAGMGFLYATGTAVPVSQAKALVHYTLGALGDSTYAQMALGYRYWAGVTVPSSCQKAMDLYMKVAAKVAAGVTLSGGPSIQRARLLDEAEGGGAGGALDSDLIEYYQLLAEKGDVQAQVRTGGGRRARQRPHRVLPAVGGEGRRTGAGTDGGGGRRAGQRPHRVLPAAGGEGRRTGPGTDGGGGGALDSDLIEYYQLLAEKGDVQAQVRTGGGGGALDSDLIEYYQLLAEKGDVQAQVRTGGGGGALDSDLIEYYQLLAEKGDVQAQVRTGGGGGALDSDLIEYYQLLAEKGDVQAQVRTGGGGGALDSDLIEYYQLLAEKGDVQAQVRTGGGRRAGQRPHRVLPAAGGEGRRTGAGTDGGGAARWTATSYYQLLAEKGDVQAQVRTGGGGGALDSDLIEYYQLLAEKGDVQAQVRTGGGRRAGQRPHRVLPAAGGEGRRTGAGTDEGGGGALDSDLIEYYQLLAEKGDVQAQVRTRGGGGALDSDLIEYYQLLAEKGDVQAQVGLGQLHFQGGRGVSLDVHKALHYFQQAAKTGNAVANAFLGKIYLEGGDGIKADNETALRYFRKAAELNNPVGQSGLGIMYLQGRGVPKDTSTALKFFTMAANQGWVEGQLHLGFMYFSGIGVRRDFKQANKYFSLASQSGHVLALYHLAHAHAQGLGVLRSCTTAVELFKNVCERGEWASRLMLGHAAWRARDSDSSLLQYLSLAERGYELAQSNAAFLLDAGEVSLYSEPERYRRALQLWGRAAAQGYSAARVKLGDYHYYGLGTPRDLEAAAHHYRIASEQLHNAQATFNLGYMHERGLGLARDLHLAKRCYDLAADTSPDARLPAALALARLNAQAALAQLAESLAANPVAAALVSGDSLSNWDVYLITALLGALGVVVYLRRPAQAN
ncbi:hypothetical protein MSG28_006726 [Choristoneura fumiferana]|uniref:Uncharacterized protein n=1 Tax=Choristoneura fumiferana TaxID=7141 RepID=A0ACC0JL67_CHOFU|nr:hypothetical protein MSG28_006726 [Choristoneura fumiferana]